MPQVLLPCEILEAELGMQIPPRAHALAIGTLLATHAVAAGFLVDQVRRPTPVMRLAFVVFTCSLQEVCSQLPRPHVSCDTKFHGLRISILSIQHADRQPRSLKHTPFHDFNHCVRFVLELLLQSSGPLSTCWTRSLPVEGKLPWSLQQELF